MAKKYTVKLWSQTRALETKEFSGPFKWQITLWANEDGLPVSLKEARAALKNAQKAYPKSKYAIFNLDTGKQI